MTDIGSRHVLPAFKAEALCLIRSDPKAASAFAASSPGSDDERAAITTLHDDLIACDIKDSISVEIALLLGGAIAEAIRLPEYPKILSGTYYGETNEFMDKNAVSESILNRERLLPRPIAAIRCAVIRNPRMNQEILHSRPGSSREIELMKRLKFDISRCVDNEISVSLDRKIIRAVIAREYYKKRIAIIPPETLYWNKRVKGKPRI